MPPTGGFLPRRALFYPDRLHFHRFLLRPELLTRYFSLPLGRDIPRSPLMAQNYNPLHTLNRPYTNNHATSRKVTMDGWDW
jgi:hypothetical protein